MPVRGDAGAVRGVPEGVKGGGVKSQAFRQIGEQSTYPRVLLPLILTRKLCFISDI